MIRYGAGALRATQILWGSLASCARPRGHPAYQRFGRVANPPQAASLPHTMPSLVVEQLSYDTGYN